MKILILNLALLLSIGSTRGLFEVDNLFDPCEDMNLPGAIDSCTPDNAMSECRHRDCDEWICLCKEGYVYNEDGTKCLRPSYLGESCNPVTHQCLHENVYCDATDNVCKCKVGTKPDGVVENGTAHGCYRGEYTFDRLLYTSSYNLSCNDDLKCAAGEPLVCADNTCQCPDGFHLASLSDRLRHPYNVRCRYDYYDIEVFNRTHCIPKPVDLLAECEYNEQCPRNAGCEYENCTTKKCICDEGFSPDGYDEDGKAVLSPTKCLKHRHMNESCDSATTLCVDVSTFCVGGVCTCELWTKPDFDIMACVSPRWWAFLGEACVPRYHSWSGCSFDSICNPNTRICECGPSTVKKDITAMRRIHYWSVHQCAAIDTWIYNDTSACSTTSSTTTTTTPTTTTTTTPFTTTTPKPFIDDPCINGTSVCPGNSTCRAWHNCSTICLCDDTFVENRDKDACIKVKELGESCKNSQQCGVEQSICNGVCVCTKATKQVGKRCVMLFHAYDNECTSAPADKCELTTTCSSGVCRCERDMRPLTDYEKMHRPNYLRPCVSTSNTAGDVCNEPIVVNIFSTCDGMRLCPGNATCTNGICGCDFGYYQKSDATGCLEVVVPSGSPMTCDPTLHFCLGYKMECEQDGLCGCPEGYANDGYTCYYSLNGILVMPTNVVGHNACDVNLNRFCFDGSTMTCDSGTCRCADGFRQATYNEKMAFPDSDLLCVNATLSN